MPSRRGTRWARTRLPSRIMVLLLALALVPQARASDPAGRVVDQEGKAVPGATVWAIGRSWAEPAVSAQATTDGSGRFTLPGAWKLGELKLMYLGLFARADDGRVGWVATVWRNQPGSQDVTIAMGEVGDVTGRLIDESGKPIPGCDISVDSLDRSPGKPDQFDAIRLPESVAKAYKARSGVDGQFMIRGIPGGAGIRAAFRAPGLGEPGVSWTGTTPATITLDRRLGALSGRLKPPDARGLAGTMKLFLSHESPQGKPGKEPFQIDLSRRIRVNADGTFQIADLPPGRYELTPEFSADAPFSAKPPGAIEIKPGTSITALEIPLARIPMITGRIVDETSGQGIAGVSLRAYRLERNNSLSYGNQATTDASGNYKLAIEPGMVILEPDGPPATHMGILREACPKLEVKTDRTWPDLKLARAVAIDGVVVDASGEPVAGAEVHLVVPDVQGSFRSEAPETTHPDGSFRLEHLDPDDRIPVRARSQNATTDGAILIRTKDQTQKGKLSVTVDPKYAFRVRGRVVDQRGKPVAGAPAMLWWNRLLVSEKAMLGTGIGNALDALKTDQDGQFLSRPLWPGDRYKVSIESKVFAKAETPEIEGSAGRVHDFGTISLVEVSAHVAGRVVGSDGKPIAGARVFNRGDSPRPTATETLADGRFQLDGLYSGSRFAFARRDGFRFGRLADALKTAQRKFVFVLKDGYRFKGAAVDGEADDLTIRLLKQEEPPPAWKPQANAPFDEERAFAKRTLIRLWEKYGENAGQNGGWRLVNQMASLDPELALTWSAQNGNRFDEDVRIIAAKSLAETDGPAALKRLTDEKGTSAQHALQELADRFLGSDRDKPRSFAEAAATRAQKLNQPERAMALARAGAVLVKSGDSEAGRKLIEEAALAAAKLGTSEHQAYGRGTVAQALALLDINRALALVEPIKDHINKDRYTAFIIEAIAATNPQKALELVDTLETNGSTPQTLKTEIAYAITPTRPDEAIRIVDGMKKGHGAEKHQAEAFGWLAVAIAPTDKARAFALIERALAMPIDKTAPFGSYTYFGGALASSAGIALNARKIGYPDMEGVLMQVMAARPDGQSDFSNPAMQTLSATIATPLVALLDPAAAKTILGQIEARSGLSPPELAKVAGKWWLAAWALSDPKHAEGLVEAELAALDTQKLPNMGNSALLMMTEVLTTPPDRREDYFRERIGASWWPGFSH